MTLSYSLTNAMINNIVETFGLVDTKVSSSEKDGKQAIRIEGRSLYSPPPLANIINYLKDEPDASISIYSRQGSMEDLGLLEYLMKAKIIDSKEIESVSPLKRLKEEMEAADKEKTYLKNKNLPQQIYAKISEWRGHGESVGSQQRKIDERYSGICDAYKHLNDIWRNILKKIPSEFDCDGIKIKRSPFATGNYPGALTDLHAEINLPIQASHGEDKNPAMGLLNENTIENIWYKFSDGTLINTQKSQTGPTTYTIDSADKFSPIILHKMKQVLKGDQP